MKRAKTKYPTKEPYLSLVHIYRGAVLPCNLIVHIYFFYGMGFCLFIGKCIVPGCRYAVGFDIDCNGFRVIRITGVVDSGNTKCLICLLYTSISIGRICMEP